MFKKIVGLVTLACFTLCTIGGCSWCYSNRLIRQEQSQPNPEYCISKVVTIDGEIIKFKISRGKGGVITDDRIEGFLKDNTFKSIPLSKVAKIYVRKFDIGKTVLLSVGGTAFAVLVMALLWQQALNDWDPIQIESKG
jgi:hypothetical protein